jgi:glucan 1,3-beta-glucosidase
MYLYGAGFWTFFDNLAGCAGISSTCQTNAVEFVSNPSGLFCWNLNTRGVLNPVIVNVTVLGTMNDNAGSWAPL